jgi:K+-sensing histidine kinase KdpD
MSKRSKKANGTAQQRRKKVPSSPVEKTASVFGLKRGDSAPSGSHADRMKTEFMSIASHELRTPLSNITEAVSQMIDGIHGEIRPEQRKVLEIAHRNCQRLGRLISDLFRITPIEFGSIVLNGTFSTAVVNAPVPGKSRTRNSFVDQMHRHPDRKIGGVEAESS